MNMIYKNETDTSKKPAQRRHDANLNRILNAAMKIVEDEGLEKLTIHRLAEKLDYTVGALYRYYASKDAIIAELQVLVIEHIFNLLTEVESLCNSVSHDKNQKTGFLFYFQLLKRIKISLRVSLCSFI